VRVNSHTPSADISDFRPTGERALRLSLAGTLLVLIGISFYLTGSILAVAEWMFELGQLRGVREGLIHYSSLPVLAGVIVIGFDLFVLLPRMQHGRQVLYQDPKNKNLTVVLTAYNDEQSIGDAVKDFLSHPLTKRVIVVDNNSRDGTAETARRAGAEVIIETRTGYGYCVFRALSEGVQRTDTGLTLLCEGDMTFRAFDIDKFMAYIPHVDLVNGTRIVEQLRASQTQLSTFMYYGNFAVGKLLEIRHLGKGTFTDVGTTYKLCRNEPLQRLLRHLDPSINLEFNAHFLDMALECGVHVVECPVTFFPRVGQSKGGNASNLRACKVGLRMIVGLVLGWYWLGRAEPRTISVL
jgi:hypothetical protein